MLDGVHGPGQLIDAGVEGIEQIGHQGAGHPDLAGLLLVALERDGAGGVAQQRHHPHRGRGLQVAVVTALAQPFQERRRDPLQVRAQPVQQVMVISPDAHGRFDRGPGRTQGAGLGVDGQGRFVPEQMPDHRRQDERQLRICLGHGR